MRNFSLYLLVSVLFFSSWSVIASDRRGRGLPPCQAEVSAAEAVRVLTARERAPSMGYVPTDRWRIAIREFGSWYVVNGYFINIVDGDIFLLELKTGRSKCLSLGSYHVGMEEIDGADSANKDRLHRSREINKILLVDSKLYILGNQTEEHEKSEKIKFAPLRGGAAAFRRKTHYSESKWFLSVFDLETDAKIDYDVTGSPSLSRGVIANLLELNGNVYCLTNRMGMFEIDSTTEQMKFVTFPDKVLDNYWVKDSVVSGQAMFFLCHNEAGGNRSVLRFNHLDRSHRWYLDIDFGDCSHELCVSGDLIFVDGAIRDSTCSGSRVDGLRITSMGQGYDVRRDFIACPSIRSSGDKLLSKGSKVYRFSRYGFSPVLTYDILTGQLSSGPKGIVAEDGIYFFDQMLRTLFFYAFDQSPSPSLSESID